MAEETRTYTTEELLIALGKEVVRIRKSVWWVTLFAAVNAIVLALFVFGIVQLEFRPL